MPQTARAESRGVLEAAFERDRRYVWGLCYRLTGSASDADDLVQETWLRALERPPADLESELRPWLARVAANLGRDALRRRRRRGYAGSWVPAPIPDDLLEDDPAERPDARYGRTESATQAFLIALEALTPAQRAVLLLRDVYDLSVRETASATGMSEANVKTTLHRARRGVASYDTARCRPTPELREQMQVLLTRLAVAIASHDPTAIAAFFEQDAELWSDANGTFLSNARPLHGAAPISRFYAKRGEKTGPPRSVELVSLNHLPAIAMDLRTPPNERTARFYVIQPIPSPNGRIARLLNVVAREKLTKVRFEGDV